MATAARCRGLVAAAGHQGAALEHLGSAVELHGRLEQPFELARTELVLGTVQRRGKQKRMARESLGSALAIFDELGAPLWADKARAELARIGGRASAGNDLTPSERRIAELVAEGRTNREVAAAAFVSVKTVEANLSRIYAKLGVRSRAGLAHLMADDERP
jgi:DNA-binding CsgD family transcriptional regulator